MTNATFFGEVIEKRSRAILYSDEESDEDYVHKETRPENPRISIVLCSSTLTADTSSSITQKLSEYTRLIVSQESFKKIGQSSAEKFSQKLAKILVNDDVIGLVFGTESDSLWCVFDLNSKFVRSYDASLISRDFLVELFDEFPSITLTLILSCQFVQCDAPLHLKSDGFPREITILGQPMVDPIFPSINHNKQLEMSLFELLMIASHSVAMIFLPDPKLTIYSVPNDCNTLIPPPILKLTLGHIEVAKSNIYS